MIDPWHLPMGIDIGDRSIFINLHKDEDNYVFFQVLKDGNIKIYYLPEERFQIVSNSFKIRG